MDEHIKCVVLLFVSLVVYEYDVVSKEFSPLSENYMDCLIYAGGLHESMQSSFCDKSPPDLSVWQQEHAECDKICTIESHNISCFDNTTRVRAAFQFDIKLPVNAYSFGLCKSCSNITQINITCMLNKTSMKSEPHSTKNAEMTTSKMTSGPHSTLNEKITTSTMISKRSDDKVEIIVAALLSGAVFGSLVTIGVWILKQKCTKDKLWKRRSIVRNPTYNESTRTSNLQPEPVVSTRTQYLEIAPQNSYIRKEENAIYNHLNEKPENTEDTDSPYDHAQYQQNQPDTILDSDYMHINKL